MYAVWFSDDNNKEAIVAFSRSRSRATELAKKLYPILVGIEKRSNVRVGLYEMEQDIIYTSRKPKRGTILPLNTSLN